VCTRVCVQSKHVHIRGIMESFKYTISSFLIYGTVIM